MRSKPCRGRVFGGYSHLFFLGGAAYAQTFSAGGFDAAHNSSSSDSCRAEALSLNQRLITARQLINTIINCNEDGQVYDSATDTCVTPVLSPDHQFDALSAGSTLALENTDGTFGTAVVIGGAPGANINCEPEDPVVPPPPPPPPPPPGTPDSCRAPWGAVVTHGSSVTAFRTSSVPDGQTCARETRTCNDGTLSGPYTFRDCIVLDPDPPVTCSLPWGGSINVGQTVTAFQEASVAPTASCTSETRTCQANGSLTGSFTNRSCTVREPVTTCSSRQWDFDGRCRTDPGGNEVKQCNNFNLFNIFCRGQANCTIPNLRRIMDTCAVCNVEAEVCITR